MRRTVGTGKARPEAIIREMRALHRRGVRITARDMFVAGEERLYHLIRTRLGGIKSARAAAGLEFPSRESLSDEQLADELRACAARNGYVLREALAPSVYRAVMKRYGSLPAARRAIGIENPTGRVPRNKADIVRELRKMHASGIPVTAPEVRKRGLAVDVRQTFSTLPAARRAAGIRVRRHRVMKLYTKAELVEELTRWIAQDVTRFDALPFALQVAVRKHFPGWREALAAAEKRM